ncbi:MAG TPA: hypothetical protein GX529_04735 [Firmicutes bacterium]|nr:hypothetical protein [Candidatus Fermentithermobacillaceae bacterium]
MSKNVYIGDRGRVSDEAETVGALASAGFDGAESHALLGKDLGGTELSGGQWQKLLLRGAGTGTVTS